MSGKTTLLAIIAASAMWLLAAVAPSAALAAGCGCHKPPPPPPPCGCKQDHHNHNNRGIDIKINVETKASASASSSATALTTAGSGSNSNSGAGGGGGGSFSPPMYTGVIQGMNVEGETQRAAYEESRSSFEKVVIQAFCFDDKDVPHPASQTSPDRDIDETFDGELYRCIAGTHMQVTIAKWNENISFEGGQTLTCQKGEALYHVPGKGGGKLECRPQKPARDCNERSLLRRFGAGIKILTMEITEKYTAYREESHESSGGGVLSLDGGVGGVAY